MAGFRGFVGEMEPVKLGPFPTFPKKEEGDSLFVAQGIDGSFFLYILNRLLCMYINAQNAKKSSKLVTTKQSFRLQYSY